MTTFFHRYYTNFRAISIGILIALSFLACISGYAKGLDMHVRVPGGEEDRMEQENRDKKNEKAFKRERNATRDGRDVNKKDKKKSRDHIKHKMVKHG